MSGWLRRIMAATCGIALTLTVPTAVGGARGASQETSAAAAEVPHHPSCERRIAVTFDDGPSVYRTATLRTLRRKGVPATFFDVGMRWFCR